MARPGHYASCTAAAGERCWCEAKHYGEMLIVAFIILVIELVAAYFSRSLALYADAWHVAADNFALVLNLVTAILAMRRRHLPRLVAFWGGLLLLFLVAIWIIVEGWHRLEEPHPVVGSIMMIGAAMSAALLFWQIRQHGRVAHEHKDAAHGVMHKHFRKDFLLNGAVVAGGLLVLTTGWSYVDPLLSIGIGVYILVDLAFGHSHGGYDHHHH